MLLAKHDAAWDSEWEPWKGIIPDEGVMHLYDCVVAVEGLHMCISNGLAITHEFGCVPQ